MTSSDNTGLGLFDDAASAAGNFPSALRGYDRAAVDDYVRSLEATMVQVRQQAAGFESQVGDLRRQLEESRHNNDVDYTNLGGRASEILRLAEEQAREVLDRATHDAEHLREEARREADSTRDRAAREGNELKSGGLAEIDKVRARLEADGATHLDRAKAEAEALLEAGRRQAESLRREAEHDVQAVRQQTYLDTEELRRTVEREIADTRQQIAVEREAALTELRRAQEEASGQTSAMLTEATRYHEESAARLEADILEATRIREDALRDADQLKLTSIKEAEDRVESAKKQAAAISERTQQEFSWRKEQLRRETDLLSQRKQAVLAQLASLSALAQETATSFPEPYDLDDFDGELGDRTVALPPGLAPALPESQKKPEPRPAADTDDSDDT
ncbi:MAG TPA: DivIVA domain-containing protein, partial [Microlunatus sp.]|nr:DivIVA domain-containing protein [Microlunatus sp.]